MKIYGKATIQIREGDRIVDSFTTKNLVVLTGRQWIAARFKDAGIPAQMSHMAIGTSPTPAVSGDTALGTEISRVTVTSSVISGDRITFVASFPPGSGVGTVTEAGIFNAASAGTMLNRITFPEKAKTSTSYLDIIWDVRVGAAP